MTISQLQCFLMSADQKSFSQAAKTMYKSQPTISKQVSQLEDELGFQLFERQNDGLCLTPAGALAYDFFNRMFMEYDAMKKEALRLIQGSNNCICIGCLEGMILEPFYKKVRDHFVDIFPNLEIRLEGLTMSEISKALKSGKVDVVVAISSLFKDNPDIPNKKLCTRNGILLFGDAHPLSDKADLCVEDFKDDIFYTIDEADGYRHTSNYIRSFCGRHGFEPRIVNLPGFMSTMIRMRSEGGVLLVTDWMVGQSMPGISSIKTDAEFDMSVGWLENGHNQQLKRMVVNEIVTVFNESVE